MTPISISTVILSAVICEIAILFCKGYVIVVVSHVGLRAREVMLEREERG